MSSYPAKDVWPTPNTKLLSLRTGIGGLTNENSWLLPVAPPVELNSIMFAGLLVTSEYVSPNLKLLSSTLKT